MGGDNRHNKRDTVAIIAAGGNGTRLDASGGKQLLEVAGKPVLSWTVDAIAAAESVDEVIIACDPKRVAEYASAVSRSVSTRKRISFVPGGLTRQMSVYSALLEVKSHSIVIIHDGARPLIEPEVVEEAIETLREGKADALSGVVVGYPTIDTIKAVDESLIITSTPDRATLWNAQTPQVFWTDELYDAYEYARTHGVKGTDDASLMEQFGKKVVMIKGPRDNIKITLEEDIAFAQGILALRVRE
ncbi:MAG: 2-C-methyl-D-erythritol 4-phosphate cytidylyltransferase [Coriobacteriia bacterium]|nr:2-C-methyl-D-erythritol 4-phosphate cytidylyltransferase [Coriobacteriia bacterium]